MVATTAKRPPNTRKPTQCPAGNEDQRAQEVLPEPRSPVVPDDVAAWIEEFLDRLEAKGFFDESKSRDIRTILE